MSTIVTQLFEDLCYDTPIVLPRSFCDLFTLRRIIAQTSIPMIRKVEPQSLRLIIENVFENDGVINWGRILVIYKFAEMYCNAYPDQRSNVRIIMFNIMNAKLKPWIVVNHMVSQSSYIAAMFTVLH
jgi:hypothetical protein